MSHILAPEKTLEILESRLANKFVFSTWGFSFKNKVLYISKVEPNKNLKEISESLYLLINTVFLIPLNHQLVQATPYLTPSSKAYIQEALAEGIKIQTIKIQLDDVLYTIDTHKFKPLDLYTKHYHYAETVAYTTDKYFLDQELDKQGYIKPTQAQLELHDTAYTYKLA